MHYVPTYFNRNINMPELIIYDPIPLAGRFSFNCIRVFGIFEKSKKNTYINKHKQKVNSHVVRSKTSGLGVYGCVISDIFCNCNEKYDLRNMNFPVPRFSAIIYGKHAICGLR